MRVNKRKEELEQFEENTEAEDNTDEFLDVLHDQLCAFRALILNLETVGLDGVATKLELIVDDFEDTLNSTVEY